MLTKFFRRALMAVVGGWQMLLRWWPRLFGDLSWTPPVWVATLQARIARNSWLAALSRRGQAARDWIGCNPRRALRAVVALALVSGAAFGAYLWYDHLPKPVLFSLQGTTPGATPLKENARPEGVQIDFSGSAARLEQIGKPIGSEIKITPPIAGEWVWVNDSRLSFTPKQDWAVDQQYLVEFERSLFPEHVRLSKYAYRFRSAPFSAAITQVEFYQDPRDPKLKKVVATLRFSHPVASADLEKRISLRMRQCNIFSVNSHKAI